MNGEKAAPDAEFTENKENVEGMKNDVTKNCALVKKEKVSSENGGMSSKSVAESREERAGQENKEAAAATTARWDALALIDFEVKGIHKLIQRLRSWDRAIENCPEEIPDQEALLDRLEVSCFLSVR